MRLPYPVVVALRDRTHRLMDSRPPDFTIERAGGPYLHRWFVWPDRSYVNCYAHRFVRDDTDGDVKHDHPWDNLTVNLDGTYIEHMADGPHIRRVGDVSFRRAHEAHRITLLRDIDSGWTVPSELPAETLFITGPKIREWGFDCPNGWRHNLEYVNPDDPGQIGKGCD